MQIDTFLARWLGDGSTSNGFIDSYKLAMYLGTVSNRKGLGRRFLARGSNRPGR